jgi:hypothetical protein
MSFIRLTAEPEEASIRSLVSSFERRVGTHWQVLDPFRDLV